MKKQSIVSFIILLILNQSCLVYTYNPKLSLVQELERVAVNEKRVKIKYFNQKKPDKYFRILKRGDCYFGVPSGDRTLQVAIDVDEIERVEDVDIGLSIIVSVAGTYVSLMSLLYVLTLTTPVCC